MPLVITKDWLTIGEVSELTGVPIHTLRFWESEFSQYFSPIRTNGRQRRYNEEAVEAVQMIKNLLKEEKYSIAGAKQVLERQMIIVDQPIGLKYQHLDQEVIGQNSQPSPKQSPTAPTVN